MSVKKRFLEHLEAKGAIPKGYACGGMAKGYAMGGMVDEEDEWQDDGWNDHDDQLAGPEGYAFGGKIVAPKHGDQVDQDMSEEEIRKHMVKAIHSRRGRY